MMMMIWQMMVALLHSSASEVTSVWRYRNSIIIIIISRGQRGTETQRKDVKNLLYSRRLLMMMGEV